VRRAWPFALTLVVLASCGGSGEHSVTVLGKPAPFAGTVARTTASRTVRFEQRTVLTVAGSTLQAAENGAASLVARRAHVYKQLASGGIPGEIVVIGAITYTNANVQAALNDPSVPPWTKLDTRKLNARERANQADELGHAAAPAYLADGVAAPHRVAFFGTLTQYRGTVDPARLAKRLPASVRPWVMNAVRANYPARPFMAQFWLDQQGRARRVLVEYRTAKGSPVAIDTRYTAFGVAIDVSLPPAGEIKDVTPRR